MVEVPKHLRSLFTASLAERDDEHVIRIPASVIENDEIDPAESYRVAVLDRPGSPRRSDSQSVDDRSASADRGPPVAENDVLTVTVDAVGDQGDGIAKVDRGYVLIVSDAAPGDEVSVRVETVKPNVAFASIVDDP